MGGGYRTPTEKNRWWLAPSTVLCDVGTKKIIFTRERTDEPRTVKRLHTASAFTAPLFFLQSSVLFSSPSILLCLGLETGEESSDRLIHGKSVGLQKELRHLVVVRTRPKRNKPSSRPFPVFFSTPFYHLPSKASLVFPSYVVSYLFCLLWASSLLSFRYTRDRDKQSNSFIHSVDIHVLFLKHSERDPAGRQEESHALEIPRVLSFSLLNNCTTLFRTSLHSVFFHFLFLLSRKSDSLRSNHSLISFFRFLLTLYRQPASFVSSFFSPSSLSLSFSYLSEKFLQSFKTKGKKAVNQARFSSLESPATSSSFSSILSSVTFPQLPSHGDSFLFQEERSGALLPSRIERQKKRERKRNDNFFCIVDGYLLFFIEV